MAVLSDTDRAQLHRVLMREWEGPCSLTKAQVRALVDAADDWADTNQASYLTAANAALTAAGATTGAITATQKAYFLLYVILKRLGFGRRAVETEG